MVSHKLAAKLTKVLRTFDNPKAVKALAPYAENADQYVEAVCAELARLGFEVGPSVASLVETSGLMLMWSRFLSDRAAVLAGDELTPIDPRLVQLAMTASDGHGKNLAAAHELHARISAAEPRPQADPLDAFSSEPLPTPPASFSTSGSLPPYPGVEPEPDPE
jgi:hypothetical protein